jgi:predicted PurR-regulated permease PerM
MSDSAITRDHDAQNVLRGAGSHEQQLRQRCEIASYILAALALLAILMAHLIPALLAGLLVYQLVHALAPRIRLQQLHGKRARLVVVALLATLVTAGVVGMITAAALFLSTGSETLTLLLSKMAEILETSRAALPPALVHYLPVNVNEMQAQLVSWLREHADDLQGVGKDAGVTMAHILIGIIIGAMVSLREASNVANLRPLARVLEERVKRLGNAFSNVVFAQIKIATINAIATGIYLAVVLPLFGIELPLVKTMIALTFVFGLLPVVGNLISNTVIVVVSLSHSVFVAAGSLLYLVVIHKVEYFLNAKIIGTQIRARPWEILIAMLVMEALFGLSGVIAAAIYYAYLKDELVAKGLL